MNPAAEPPAKRQRSDESNSSMPVTKAIQPRGTDVDVIDLVSSSDDEDHTSPPLPTLVSSLRNPHGPRSPTAALPNGLPKPKPPIVPCAEHIVAAALPHPTRPSGGETLTASVAHGNSSRAEADVGIGRLREAAVGKGRCFPGDVGGAAASGGRQPVLAVPSLAQGAQKRTLAESNTPPALESVPTKHKASLPFATLGPTLKAFTALEAREGDRELLDDIRVDLEEVRLLADMCKRRERLKKAALKLKFEEHRGRVRGAVMGCLASGISKLQRDRDTAAGNLQKVTDEHQATKVAKKRLKAQAAEAEAARGQAEAERDTAIAGRRAAEEECLALKAKLAALHAKYAVKKKDLLQAVPANQANHLQQPKTVITHALPGGSSYDPADKLGLCTDKERGALPEPPPGMAHADVARWFQNYLLQDARVPDEVRNLVTYHASIASLQAQHGAPPLSSGHLAQRLAVPVANWGNEEIVTAAIVAADRVDGMCACGCRKMACSQCGEKAQRPKVWRRALQGQQGFFDALFSNKA